MFFRIFENKFVDDRFHLGILRQKPFAVAKIRGSEKYKRINGEVFFFNAPGGVLVSVSVDNLPTSQEPCALNIFGFHLHEGAECKDGEIPFDSAGEHYNPNSCPHPAHAGDFPPLFAGKNGHGFATFWTDRITLNEIVGKTALIHLMPDDLSTQPSGNSGERIACGVVVRD